MSSVFLATTSNWNLFKMGSCIGRCGLNIRIQYWQSAQSCKIMNLISSPLLTFWCLSQLNASIGPIVSLEGIWSRKAPQAGPWCPEILTNLNDSRIYEIEKSPRNTIILPDDTFVPLVPVAPGNQSKQKIVNSQTLRNGMKLRKVSEIGSWWPKLQCNYTMYMKPPGNCTWKHLVPSGSLGKRL